MRTELTGLINADLAALSNDAVRLEMTAVAPAQEAARAGHADLSFTQSMKDALAGVDNEERIAAQKMSDVDSGKSDDLTGAMLASQQANLSFSMLMQVRNKVMGAMDELIKLPV